MYLLTQSPLWRLAKNGSGSLGSCDSIISAPLSLRYDVADVARVYALLSRCRNDPECCCTFANKKIGPRARPTRATPHARPFVFYPLAIPFGRRSELGGPGFPSKFACGDGPARTSVSANSKFVKILYELIGPNAVLFYFVWTTLKSRN